jgi:hypothetical protein
VGKLFETSALGEENPPLGDSRPGDSAPLELPSLRNQQQVDFYHRLYKPPLLIWKTSVSSAQIFSLDELKLCGSLKAASAQVGVASFEVIKSIDPTESLLAMVNYLFFVTTYLRVHKDARNPK